VARERLDPCVEDRFTGGGRVAASGSSSGLGESIARLLAAEGADVVVHGRDEVRAKAVAAESVLRVWPSVT
jgi:NADP-dependent 3-hydroxy acid dehydrogenase YdfG